MRKSSMALGGILALTGALASGALAATYDRAKIYIAETDLTDQERAGAEIWYKATAGNGRFHTYVYQQRLGVLIDWFRILNAEDRPERFKIWGLINDPDCCIPGAPGCPAKSLEETYGFEWCPGDAELLRHVGRHGYRDPACDFEDPAVPSPRIALAARQDACDLEFGTSTGALGLRKFPNTRFDADRWREVNGGRLGTWEGFNRRLASGDEATVADARVSHLADPSIEPPFLIGMACGACHIAFNPAKPPADPANPRWENLMGAIGNQYTRVSEIMASGQSKHSVEFQLFGHARPGTVDTSAVPNDQVNNPGTMNAIINFDRRPTHPGHVVVKWRPVGSCPAGTNGDCWCEEGRPGKCWRHGTATEAVHGIVKGGEDSTGVLEAIQRVYFNIGSCSEQCWLNHLTDLFQLDPDQRNWGQTPFDIGQCRRDCPNLRAIEDRLDDIGAFLLTRRPTDLYQAKGLEDVGDLVEWLETAGGYAAGAVERGRLVFAQNCARCHSSQPGPDFTRYTFRETDADGVRRDWLGNDQPTPASELGSYPCRALHSNHMAGHVWEGFASETYRARPADAALADESGGGRGYMRNVSLINLWAHAPFLHNNAIGPEICGRPSKEDLYTSPYVDGAGLRLADPPACWAYDPSVEGRFALYKASMDELLHPDRRVPKVTLRNEPIVLELGPRVTREGSDELYGVRLELPPGRSTGFIVSLRHKELVRDLVLVHKDPEALRAKLVARFGAEQGGAYFESLRGLAGKLAKSLKDPYRVIGAEADMLVAVYCSCTTAIENGGHRFGEDLPAADKQALTAFLATL